MSTQLVNLRGVPDDEADDIRQLLEANNIAYYETSAGNWGVSMPAIWLTEDYHVATAERLLQAYQVARAEKARGEYQQLKSKGQHRTLIDEIKENPLRFAAYVAIATFVLFFSIKPFVDMIA